MDRSSPKSRFFLKKRDFFLFLFVLSAVAVFFYQRSEPNRVTISGLHLDDTRKSVASHLRFEDYRMFNVSEWEERWYRMDSAGINVIYDAEGSVHGIEGGVPQIDGIDATHWTAEQLEQALGTARYSGQSSLIGETERGFRSFPQHRLIVYLEAKGNRFCLFRSGR